MVSSICSSFRAIIPRWTHTNKNFRYCLLMHCKRKHSFGYSHLTVSSAFNDDSVPPTPNPKQSQASRIHMCSCMNYDPSEDLFGIYADLQPRKGLSNDSSPRSWFGPNGQYIRELPCPSCSYHAQVAGEEATPPAQYVAMKNQD
ncbi:hypothetical protein LXL04_007878 [Taraxacum kok-saghyz]